MKVARKGADSRPMTEIREGPALPLRALVATLAIGALAVATGCAMTPAATTAPATPTAGTAHAATTPTAGPAHPTTAPAPQAAAIDSGPSPDAIAVLQTIPEPLKPGERVPPADRPAAVPMDSTAQTPADTSHDNVPVPAPTSALGERPSGTASTPPVTPPPAAAAAPAYMTGPKVNAPPPDTCWRVQVGAPTEEEKAKAVRDAAISQLLIPMVIEPEKGLFKVRTRDCMSGATADALKKRAATSGFEGAFRFIGARH
jgi:SPOR domain